MRIFEKTTFTLSEDDISSPVNILMQSQKETADTSSCTKSVTVSSLFSISTTHTIDLGDITQGKFLYIKPTLDVTAILDGESIVFKGGKESFLWANFTTLDLTVGLTANRISLAVGGT